MTRKTIVIISDDDIKVIIEEDRENDEAEKTELVGASVSAQSVRTGGKRTPT